MVKESAAAPGTNTTITLSGAQAGFRSFANEFGNGVQAYYFITDGSQTEAQLGTVTVSGSNTLSRGTPLWTTTGVLTRLNFTGTTTVYAALPASRAPYYSAAAPAGVASDVAARVEEVSWRFVSTVTIVSSVFGVTIALPSGYVRYRVEWADVASASAVPLYLRYA